MKLNFRKIPIILYLAAGILMMQSVSCKKFLNVQPRDYMFEEEAFSTPVGVQTVLNGIYQSMSDSLLYGNMMTLNLTENMAQYYTSFNGALGSNFTSFTYTSPVSKRLFDGIWKKAYLNIIGINNFCKKLEDPKFDVLKAEERDIMLGEAYAIRAFYHFDQLRFFGPVYARDTEALSIPYVTQPIAEAQPLLPASEVLTRVLADLEAAAKLMEKDPIRTSGPNRVVIPPTGETLDYLSNRHRRMNYFAVRALTARVLLYANKKTEAWTVASSLLAEQEVFFPWQTEQTMVSDPLLTKESYFGIDNRSLYSYYRNLFSPLLSDDIILTPSQLRLEGMYNPTTNDSRAKHWFKVGTEGEKSYKVFVKFSNQAVPNASIQYYQPLLRKSELYLIAAETSPDLQRGYFYLNTQRVNRGLSPINFGSGSSIYELENAIKAEYEREFIGEGQLFFMHKRMNTSSIIAPNGSSWINMFQANTSGAVRVMYVVPLPENETYYR